MALETPWRPLVHADTAQVLHPGYPWWCALLPQVLVCKFPNQRDFSSNTENLVFPQEYVWLYDSRKVMVSKGFGYRVFKLEQCFPEKRKKWTSPYNICRFTFLFMFIDSANCIFCTQPCKPRGKKPLRFHSFTFCILQNTELIHAEGGGDNQNFPLPSLAHLVIQSL